jgi:hypothetical protein
MSSPWTELLFLHGHIADARLARRLAMPARVAPPAVVGLAATKAPPRVLGAVSVDAVSDVREAVSADGYPSFGD